MTNSISYRLVDLVWVDRMHNERMNEEVAKRCMRFIIKQNTVKPRKTAVQQALFIQLAAI